MPGAWSTMVVQVHAGPLTALLKVLRQDLEAAGVSTRTSDGEELYGVHAFRRGAAQAMARAGWSESTIKAYLRWESGCVALYIAEAPLALSRRFAASLWGSPGAALGQAGAQGSLIYRASRNEPALRWPLVCPPARPSTEARTFDAKSPREQRV